MQYLPYVAGLALTVGFAWLISGIGGAGGPIDRMVGALANLVGGYRGESWPVGVQEEDRDRPWGENSAASPEPAVEVKPVVPAVRVRL